MEVVAARNVVLLSLLIPVYNDWAAAAILCRSLVRAFGGNPQLRMRLVIVDDGSSDAAPPSLLTECGFECVSVVRLKRNLGHQRAIAIGLCWLQENASQDAVLVMDGDGEDRPEDGFRLLEAFLNSGQNAAVFAARRRRMEGRLFWFGYHSYRLVHRILTGVAVEIGNFSVLPAGRLGELTNTRDLWSHYAAATVKAKIPIRKVPLDRGTRLAGKSKMNYLSLTRHGLSALGVFGALVTTRLISITGVTMLALGCFLLSTYSVGGQSFVLLNLTVTATVLLLLLVYLIFAISVAYTAAADKRAFPLAPLLSYKRFVERDEQSR